VQIAAITPSDASHVLGLNTSWDRHAATMGLELFCRQNTGAGKQLAATPEHMARMIVDQLSNQTVGALLETAFDEDPSPFETPSAALAQHELSKRGLDHHRGLVKIDLGLNTAVIGLGASASTYYSAVGDRLGCEMILPEHAGVANAIGAVVGRVTIRQTATVTAPSSGLFMVHLDGAPTDFQTEDSAMSHVENELRALVIENARKSGAMDIETHVTHDIKRAQVEGNDVFIEATVTVEASGRPRIAS